MANNRLYLIDEETGDELLIAKGWSSGWQPFGDLTMRLTRWLEDRDIRAALGCANCSRLRLHTENDSDYDAARKRVAGK